MKQDKFLIGILVGILVLVAAAVGLFYTRQGGQGYVADDSPGGVVHNYVYAVQQEQYEKAYDFLGEGLNKPTQSEFQSMVSAYRSGYTSDAVEIMDTRIIENADGSQEAVVDLAHVPRETRHPRTWRASYSACRRSCWTRSVGSHAWTH